MVLTPEHRAKISASSKGVPKSPEHRAALKASRAERGTSPAQAENARRLGKTPNSAETRTKQAASLSVTMKGRPRTPAQAAVLDAARAKAHAGMLGNSYGGFRGSFAEFGPTLRQRDGDLCQLCLKPIDFELPVRTPMSRSVDHITPVRAGGRDDIENLWLSHVVCNQRKGSRHVGRLDGTTDPRRI